MKFQNRSIHGSKVNRRTDRQTDRQAESNMPFQLFQSLGHNKSSLQGAICATFSLSNRFAHIKRIDGLHYENMPMQ